jgi:site-specific recombinase XerC
MRLATVAQVTALADAIPRRYRALVLVAAYTGLRWGELAGLRVKRVDLLHRQRLITVFSASSRAARHHQRRCCAVSCFCLISGSFDAGEDRWCRPVGAARERDLAIA